jgi:periplasmic protein TonB
MFGMRPLRSSKAAVILLALGFRFVGFGNADEQIRDIGPGITPPKLVHKVEPEYTNRAKKAKLHGLVKLRIAVSSTGVPEHIEVTDALDPDLDARAIDAVSKWLFKPAMENGKPIAVWAKVEVKFRLCCGW